MSHSMIVVNLLRDEKSRKEINWVRQEAAKTYEDLTRFHTQKFCRGSPTNKTECAELIPGKTMGSRNATQGFHCTLARENNHTQERVSSHVSLRLIAACAHNRACPMRKERS